MEAKQITIKTLAFSCAAVLLVEAVVRGTSLGSSLAALGGARLLQIALMLRIVMLSAGGVASIGLERAEWFHGLRRGALWSLAFGAVALCAWFALHMAGVDFLAMIRMGLPQEAQTLVLLFLVGGIIAPVAEEIFFRGLIYGFFRRWGVAPALLMSTLLFVLPHAPGRGLPVTQIVGGFIFALSYEREGNLLVPITIHVLGNLAIFAISALL